MSRMTAPLALYPGSFDPVTVGHVDMIRRAARLFGQVVVLVSPNSAKQPMFTAQQRVRLLQSCTREIPGVRVDCSDELLAEYARRIGATALIRGVRNAQDLAYEQSLAQVYHHLNPQLETVLLMAEPATAWISSTVVREMLRYHQDISEMVPAGARELLSVSLQEENDHEKH